MTSETKKLYRSNTERMISGVCGGLAEYFDIDPTVVRLIFVAATLLGGPGLLAYIILLILMPNKPVEETDSQAPETPEVPES